MAGIFTAVTMLKDTTERLQRLAIPDFVSHKLVDMSRRSSTLAVAMVSNFVELDISWYSGEGLKCLALNQ